MQIILNEVKDIVIIRMENNVREISYAQAIKECMEQAMIEDESVFLIGEDVGLYGGAFGVSEGLVSKIGPERIIDTPISEQGIVGVAIGTAIMGFRPIVEIMFSDFLMLTMDQVSNQAAKLRYMFGGKVEVPIVIRTPGGGGIGLAAQHSQSLEAILLNTAGLKIVMPSSAYDVKGLLSSAIKDDNPVIFLEHKLLYKTKGDVPLDTYEIPLGKAEIKRKGNDITVIATSHMVQKALKVADKLEKEGIDIEVIDPRTIKPLDINLILESLKKTNKALLVEEACYTGGFTCFVTSEIMRYGFDYLDAPVRRVTGLDCPIPYEHNLEDTVIPNEVKIEEGIREVIGNS